MLQYLSEGTGDTGELDISSCEQTIRRSDASDIPSPERERAGIFPTGSPFLISSNLSWEDRPKLAAGASGAAALLTCCALHPFDLIKTRMQVAAVSGGAIPSYGSTRRAITRIYKQEGLRGLWKGVGVTAAASSTSWTCFRYIFDRLGVKFPVWREALCGTSSRTNEVTQRTSLDDVASGLVAGVLVTFLTHPLWLAKARMEMQAKEAEVCIGLRANIMQASGWPQFRNGFNCIVSAVRGGVRESYRGVGPALALAPHAAIQIAVYEQLKRSQ
ncbi:mitochondrial carrier domain-containing protein, putative [Eimeria maxima]|uniref:Mitochondrial carrier domain-containing protein, putative n=1 Tax=Eimeria maxima TaxID=5804 RepID=U6LYN6_EIMMA|nr:mitochondrial carrier domain-containing protein, putative [Eimeria maxima]CDJ55988.1 mitochondrial carrier domain-containing protein, putative [Eimeria maxima]